MTKRNGTSRDLRAEITEALMRDVGVSERMAQPFVESIMACFAGDRPYFPAKERRYPMLEIRASLESGVSVSRVLQDFEISRRTLHDLFPGGLPKPDRSRRKGP
ncbi:MAG: hypothetical protein ACREO8_09115 [Luteimonas sp.]